MNENLRQARLWLERAQAELVNDPTSPTAWKQQQALWMLLFYLENLEFRESGTRLPSPPSPDAPVGEKQVERLGTNYYVCTKCEKPCEVLPLVNLPAPPYGMEWERESKCCKAPVRVARE